jgi:AcrR family transcriptional regulator
LTIQFPHIILETENSEISFLKMNKDRQEILDHSREMFLREGFNKTTMDDIAGRMKISKKTIYKNFASKEELVREALVNFVLSNKQKINELANSQLNAIEKCFDMLSFVGTILIQISEKFLNDIRTFMPDLWNEIDRIRTKILYPNLKAIIEQGQHEGYFIDSEKSDALVALFIISIRGVINPDTLLENKLTPVKAAQSIIELLINGILTDKGRKLFTKLKSGETK